VRVSTFFPLLAFVMWWKLSSPAMAAAVTGLLFVSVLLHEFGHVFAAQHTGGFGDEILIWPLGGLAFVEPAKSFRSQFLTAAAGPLVNLGLCALAFPFVLYSAQIAEVWNPLVLPRVDLKDHVLQDLWILTFSLNWFCLLLNLVPIFPLDGSRMLQAWLNVHCSPPTIVEIMIKVALVAAVALGTDCNPL